MKESRSYIVYVIGVCIIIVIVSISTYVAATHLRTQKQDLESLQGNVKNIELKLENLINQVGYEKAFLNKRIAAAIKDKLMIKFDGVKEIKSFINSIPLQDLLRLIIKRLDLKIVEVPASTGGYELKPVVDEKISPKKP